MKITKKTYTQKEAEELIFLCRKQFWQNKNSSSEFWCYNHHGFPSRGWMKKTKLFKKDLERKIKPVVLKRYFSFALSFQLNGKIYYLFKPNHSELNNLKEGKKIYI